MQSALHLSRGGKLLMLSLLFGLAPIPKSGGFFASVRSLSWAKYQGFCCTNGTKL
jgi:hypothetical protein